MSPHATRGGIVFCFTVEGAIQMKGNGRICIMRTILIAIAIAFASIVLSGCVPISGNQDCAVNAGNAEVDGIGTLRHYPVVL